MVLKKTPKTFYIGDSEGKGVRDEKAVLSPDGRISLLADNETHSKLGLWDLKTGKEIKNFDIESPTDEFASIAKVHALAISPDNCYALYNPRPEEEMKQIVMLDLQTGQEITRLHGHTSVVNCVAFSPDGRRALSGSLDKTIKLWDLSAGRTIQTLTGHTEMIVSVAFSPDGRYALSSSFDNTAKIWNLDTGQEVRTLQGHGRFQPGDIAYLTSAVFSPNGRQVLTTGADQTMRLWDKATGREVRRYESKDNYLNSASFSPDGRYAYLISVHGMIIVDLASGAELARRIDYSDGEYVVKTPEGYFDASADGAKHVQIIVDGKEQPLGSLYARYYRPDLVILALAGKKPPWVK